MKIFNKKMKEEIKTLINMLEYCHVYLAMSELMLIEDDTTNKIAEIELLLKNTRQRLQELGVY
mgnify:FL=1